MQDLRIDKNTIKALLSDTRILIIKFLKKRKMTVTELSISISVNDNAIRKHLKKLVNAGLVERVNDDKHKWVYYQLTKKGIDISSTNEVIFNIDKYNKSIVDTV